MSDQITIEDLVDGAIIDGFRLGTNNFVESLEAELQKEAVIEESGSAHELLQGMIDYNVDSKSATVAQESVETLDNKLNFLFS